MPVLHYVHLDVFTNQPFTGIQLAVFLDAAGIDERRMQRIANEMAFPDTRSYFLPRFPAPTRAFVFSRHPGSYRWLEVRRSERLLRSQPVTDWKNEWFEIDDAAYLNTAAYGAVPRVSVRAVQASLEAKKFPHRVGDSAFFEVPNRLRASIARLIGFRINDHPNRTSHKPVSRQSIDVDRSVATSAFVVAYVVKLPRSRFLDLNNFWFPVTRPQSAVGAIRNSQRLHRGFNTQRRMSFLLLSASALRPSWSSHPAVVAKLRKQADKPNCDSDRKGSAAASG